MNTKGAQGTQDATLGERIRAARKRAGISQEVLGEWTGLHRVVVNRLENGVISNPRLSTVYKLADGLGVGVPYLVGAEEAARPVAQSTKKVPVA